jgi:hypothetical protein
MSTMIPVESTTLFSKVIGIALWADVDSSKAKRCLPPHTLAPFAPCTHGEKGWG